MKKTLLLTYLFWVGWQAIAQNFSCGVDTARDVQKAIDMEQQYRENAFKFNVNLFRESNSIDILPTPFPPSGGGSSLVAGASCFRANFIVPVIVHVVHDSSHTTIGSNSNISVAMINDQIRLLNEQFANYGISTPSSVNTGIQFCLAPVGSSSDGIFRYGSTLTNTNTSFTEFNQLAGLIDQTLYPTDEYLHIFVVSSLNKGGGKNFAGFASHPVLSGPFQHGIVVRYQYFGDYAAYPAVCSNISKGKTLAHEVGHYFGLYHTFEEGCTGLTTATCKNQGDLCCETPPVNGQQFGCSGANSCNQDVPDLNDMITNHMAYNSDACRNMFTKDQVEIMYYTLQNIRPKLVDVKHLNLVGMPCCINSAMFSADLTSHCSTGTTIFTGLKYNLSTKYRWIIKNGSTTVFDQTNIGNNIQSYAFGTLGIYNVKLMVIEGTDTFINEKVNYINVVNCGSPLKSDNGTWFFGNRGGLSFYSLGTAPNFKAAIGGSISGPSINSAETAVTQCDNNGRLLFLAGGQTSFDKLYIWDRNHNKFPSTISQPLKGNQSSYNGLISIPHSTDGKKFLLVSVHYGSDTGYMYYRTIDTTLNGNLGEVSGRPNIPVKVPSGSISNSDTAVMIKEAIAVAKGCDSSYSWLVAIDGDNHNRNLRDSSFLVFKVRKDSIVFSHSFKVKHFISFANAIEFSPDGSKLVFGPVVYSFDKKTGQISEFLDFSQNVDHVLRQHYPNDTDNVALKELFWIGRNSLVPVCFSPNSKILYIRRNPYRGAPDSIEDTIFQIDLYKNQPMKFIRTVTTLPVRVTSAFQMGPDGKIYILRVGSDRLAVINNPDSLNVDLDPNNCGYSFEGIKIGGVNSYALPNIIDTKKDAAVNKEILFTIKNCKEYVFSTNICCATSYSWKFGDNTTSSGKTVSHTYANESTFIVKLFFNGDSMTKTIKVGGMKTKISGRTTGCDISQPTEYVSSPRNTEYDYNWKTVGGNLLATNPIQEMPISWNSTGKVIVAVTDRVTGCIARDTMDVIKQNAIINNTISNDTLFCLNGSVIVTGSTPTGGNGVYSYSWYKSRDKILWDLVSDSTRKHILNKKPDSFYYYREVNSNGCISNSGISKLAKIMFKNNLIFLSKSVCLKGKMAKFTGYGINSTVQYNYVWQYSTDNINWSNDPLSSGHTGSDTTKLNRYSLIVNTKIYVRRKISSSTCDNYSNVILIAEPTGIRKQPLGIRVCHRNSTGASQIYFTPYVKLTNSPSNLTFKWQCTDVAGTSWIPLGSATSSPGDSSITSSNNFFIPYSIGGTAGIRCLIIGCNDTLITITANLELNNNTNPTFTQTPNDVYAVPGQKAKFVAKSSSGNIQWQKSLDNGNTWANMAGETDSFIFVDVVDYCNSGIMYPPGFAFITTQYRALLSNGCKQITSLHLFAYNGKKQMMIRDYYKDFGKEPCDTSVKKGRLIPNPMISPDIAVSYSMANNPFITGDTGLMVVRDPGVTNYVFVRLRNRGNQTSLATKMELYWSHPSTGYVWNRSWTNNTANRFYNPYTSQYYPLGGKINPVTITVPATNAGQTRYMVYKWDTLNTPKAENYYRTVKIFGLYFKKYFPKNQSIAILARLPECTYSTNGMTFKETANTSENVRLNNKIAAKIRTLSYLKPPPYTSVMLDNTPILIRNAKDTNINTIVKIGFRAKDSLVTTVVDVVATLDSTLEVKWVAGGYQGSGFTILSSNRLLITDVRNFNLRNITMAAFEDGAIYFDFYRKTTPAAPGVRNYTFDVWQTSNLDTMPEGFVEIQITAPNYIAGGGGEGGGGETFTIPNPKKPSFDKPDVNFNPALPSIKFGNGDKMQKVEALTAYPNPTTNSMTVEWFSDATEPFIITVTNMLGQVVYTAEVSPSTDGNYNYEIALANNPNGIYTVEVNSEGFKGKAKVVLIK